MKKIYQKPELDVVKLAYQKALLIPMSDTNADVSGGEYADPSREMSFEW
jgi:hypothetical protein